MAPCSVTPDNTHTQRAARRANSSNNSNDRPPSKQHRKRAEHMILSYGFIHDLFRYDTAVYVHGHGQLSNILPVVTRQEQARRTRTYIHTNSGKTVVHLRRYQHYLHDRAPSKTQTQKKNKNALSYCVRLPSSTQQPTIQHV